MKRPRLVVAADWSSAETKRRMARAEQRADETYFVHGPEPVGKPTAFLSTLRESVSPDEGVLVGFDFPIGLPAQYARSSGIAACRSALAQFGEGDWCDFFEVTDHPNVRRPFYPPPTQVKGKYSRAALAVALGFGDLSELLRNCDEKTTSRRAAQCVFFTLGGAQVGRAAISGWRDVITPALDEISLWPFDGDLATLLEKPGVTVAEIYPTEAYTHLSVRIGAGTGRRKTAQKDRQEASEHLVNLFAHGPIHLSPEAKAAIERGFDSDDDFDALMGLLSMLLVVTGQRSAPVPETPEVRNIEGWILGQALPG